MAKLSIFVPFPKRIKDLKDQNLIADAIVTHIQGRTMAGFDRDNIKFSEYSEYNEEYAKKKGVGVKDIDLVLSGDMITELKAIKVSSKGVEIGFKGDKQLIGKVDGNIRGTYGQPEPIEGKARDFLGIPKDDVDLIVDAYLEEIDQAEEEEIKMSDEDLDALARKLAKEILGDIDFETEVDGQ